MEKIQKDSKKVGEGQADDPGGGYKSLPPTGNCGSPPILEVPAVVEHSSRHAAADLSAHCSSRVNLPLVVAVAKEVSREAAVRLLQPSQMTAQRITDVKIELGLSPGLQVYDPAFDIGICSVPSWVGISCGCQS